jgi:NADH:ubiquinone oxidoreductase subunit 4 (subunit M)
VLKQQARVIRDHKTMNTVALSSVTAQNLFTRILSCWNWKCALLSATARSIVYLVALSHTGRRGGLSIVLVEMAYVTLTAGLYAGMQQKALGLRNRLLGNLIVVLCVPGLAQFLDSLAHRIAGAAVPGRATLAVCIFTILSALFHLHVMRRGAFLTNHHGCSLLEDFRRMPRLILAFVIAPVVFFMAIAARIGSQAESEAAL